MVDRVSDPRASYRIAAQHYWWRLGKAFFCALELDAYATAGTRLEHPILDLGCGDGTFSAMLQAAGLVDRVDVSIDYSPSNLVRDRRASKHRVCASVFSLPLGRGTLGAVVANGVLSSIPCRDDREIDVALQAVNGVLRAGGLFLLTVPTPAFNESFRIPNTLRRMRLTHLAEAFERQIDRREAHYLILDEEAWRGKLAAADFEVEQVRDCLTSPQVAWYALLRAQPFRIMNLLRMVPLPSMARRIAAIEERLFTSLAATPPIADAQRRAGFLLIVARKRARA